MKTKKIKVYKFNELGEEAKQRVLNEFREINVDYEWYDYLLEEYLDKLKQETGWEFDEDDVVFSLGGRDGKFGVKSKSILRNIENSKNCSVEISNLPRYVGAYVAYKGGGLGLLSCTDKNRAEIVCDADITDDDKERIDDYNDRINKIIDLSYEYYEKLDREFDYLISDEAIIDTIEANEYEFLEDGRVL